MSSLSTFRRILFSALSHPAVRYAASLLLTVAFLYLAFRGTDFGRLRSSLADVNYWWMLVMFALLMLSHFLRAWRWRYLLEPIKPGLGLRNLFSAVIIGYFFNNLLPRAGELARPYSIAKLESVPKSAAFGTVVVERILDTLTFVVLVIAIPLVYNGPLLESFPWLRNAGGIVSLVSLALLAFPVILMVRRDLADRAVALASRILPQRIAGRLPGMVHAFLDGFVFLTRPANFLRIILMTGAIWGLYILMLYAAFFGFHLDGMLGLRAALVVQAISSIGVAIPTPGATGSYHAFTSQTLSRLFSVDPIVALSYATVTHAVGFVGVTLVGLYFFLKDNVSLREAVRGGEKEPT